MAANRVASMVVRMQCKLDAAEKEGKDLTALDEINEFNMDEYFALQNHKTLAVAEGVLTLDEGMTVYSYMGEAGPEKVNKQSLAVRIVLTKLLAEFMGIKA